VAGVIVQLGGQTPLGLAAKLKAAGCRSWAPPRRRSTWPRTAARSAGAGRAGLPAPRHGTATSCPRPGGSPSAIGYPVLVRPSYVLGGRGMEIVYDDETLCATTSPGPPRRRPSTPCWSTGSSTTRSRSTSTRCATATELYLGGVMEHIEEAGIHSGDSACALPPITLGGGIPPGAGRALHRGDRPRGRRAGPAQRAVRAGKEDTLYVLEANPRARAPCRSCPRPPGSRWPGRRPGSCSGRHHRRAARRGAAAERHGDGGQLPRTARWR
jgi:carbamoyl-phosphate synthase large subunit